MQRIATALLCALGTACFLTATRADDYVLINNIDAPNPADTNTAWNFGNLSVNGQVVGADPGNASGSVPTTAATAGYVVSPFTLSSALQNGASSATISEIQIAMSLQSPATLTALTGNVYGSFFTPGPGGTSLSSATQVGSWFQFNATPGLTNGKGNGTSQLLTADPQNQPALQAGQTYWLVVAPKAGLNAQNSDSLTDYAVWLQNSESALSRVGITNSTQYGSVLSDLYEVSGARNGDTLTSDTAFVGTKIFAVGSAVPECGTLSIGALGCLPTILLLRRQAKARTRL